MSASSKIHVMTPAEVEILKAGISDPNAFTDYFLRRPGQDQGWKFDTNFTEDGKWQEDMVLADQSFIVVIAGIGTGKTIGVGMGAMVHAALTPNFKFLNIARESWQSTLMYNAILEIIQDTPFEKLVTGYPKRPYPLIVIEYYIGNVKFKSTLEFMSIGEEKDATNVFSWRGDWINVEEAGRLDNLTEVVTNLSTRLTGSDPTGRAFLGRLSLISNPWDNPDLWQFFDIAVVDKENSLAINIDTRENKNVTDKQLKQMLKLVPEKDRERFLTGKRPEGRGNYFSQEAVNACENTILTTSILDQYHSGNSGIEIETAPYMGVYHFTTPRKEDRQYFLFGDPGIGTAPSRNCPVLMMWDVTEVPDKAAILVAMWWGNGGGSITPFLSKMIEWIKKYRPVFAGVDNTGPQKNTAEIVNIEYVYQKGLSVNAITGLDFSGTKRYSYLVAARISLETGMFTWPSFVTGLSSQLKNYDPIKDRNPNSKLAQDLVATFSMAAYSIRAFYGIDLTENSTTDDKVIDIGKLLRRGSRDQGGRVVPSKGGQRPRVSPR
jgi:hypothetical protein